LAKTIGEIIGRYYKETTGGIVDKAPSTLTRGEGTETEFFIQKIDLCGSTVFLKRRSPQTYLKIAHTFLSSVDEITRYFGADTNQAEYAGDSVIAYFRASDVAPVSVLFSAYYCQLASLEMQSLDRTLNQYHFKTKTVIHFGKLILSKIGPWGDGRVSAIGYELHRVCKLEKEIGDGQGRATKEFCAKLRPIDRKFLSANTITKQVPIDLPLLPPSSPLAPFALGLGLIGLANMRSDAINALATPGSFQTEPRYETKSEVVDYNVNWSRIRQHLIDQQK
jgi:hypothetical protein